MNSVEKELMKYILDSFEYGFVYTREERKKVLKMIKILQALDKVLIKENKDLYDELY